MADFAPGHLGSLIAEAKRRRGARRRLLLALGAAVVLAAAVATLFALGSPPSSFAVRSHPNSLGVCATAPSGWREKTGWEMSLGPRTTGLTNFRFGLRGDLDVYGFTAYAHRPAGSVTIALDAQSPADGARPLLKRSLHVTRDDFSVDPYGPVSWPTAYIVTRMHGHEHTAVVEVGAVTAATIAAANHALARVHTCTA